MNTSKILEMINQERISELKHALQDEIYTNSLKNKGNAKKRYAAMKKYFTYVISDREMLNKPCIVDYNRGKYTAFCNSYSLVLTKESCGELETFDDASQYLDVEGIMKCSGDQRVVNLAEIFARAKSKGYKLNKSEFDHYNYLLHFGNSYFGLGLLDSTFSIIDDGCSVSACYPQRKNAPIFIKNDIGACVVLPIDISDKKRESAVVIEGEETK